MAYSGMSGVRSDVVMIKVKNALMKEWMEEVSGPFQSSQGGLGWLVERLLRGGVVVSV